jgi:hypothetical protein
MPAPQKRLYVQTALVLVGGVLAGCAGGSASPVARSLEMAPLHDMPMDVQQAAVAVQESYQFAAANPELLAEIPCYCGCGPLGHTSNYDCYVAEVASDGAISFDPHALGCLVCVEITQDTMRILREGGSLADAREYVDTTYARYGQSNMP